MRTILMLVIMECLAFCIGIVHPVDNVPITIVWMLVFLVSVFFMAYLDRKDWERTIKSKNRTN